MKRNLQNNVSLVIPVFLFSFLIFLPAGKASSGTVYFYCGFETGDVSQWLADNNGNQTGGGYVSTEKPRTGQYSWKAYNDPDMSYPDNISAKLLRWRFDYNEAYYSAWYFWPADYVVSGVGGQYVNIFQWKERAAPYDPTWIIAVKESYQYPGKDEIVVHDYHGQTIYRNGVILPKGTWFHLEAFLKTGSTDGQLTVYLDEQQIFTFNNINTSGNPSNTTGYLMWGVGNYGDAGLGKYIYVDDAIVSDTSFFLAPPQNTRISIY